MRWRAWVLVLALGGGSLVRAAEVVEIDYRLRPGRDLSVEQVQENVTSIRVLEDRGVVAQAAQGGTLLPATNHQISRQRLRYATDAARADGSFWASLSVLSRHQSVRLPTGQEQAAGDQPELKDLVFKARIDPQGRVHAPSLEGQQMDAQLRERMIALMTGLLGQAVEVPTIRLEQDKPAQQVMNVQLPLPGLSALDLKVTTTYRLLEIKNDLARIEMVYVMDFGLPKGSVKLVASGAGGGSLLYDVSARMARSIESNSLMTIVAQLPEGTLEFQISARQTQTTQQMVAALK